MASTPRSPWRPVAPSRSRLAWFALLCACSALGCTSLDADEASTDAGDAERPEGGDDADGSPDAGGDDGQTVGDRDTTSVPGAQDDSPMDAGTDSNADAESDGAMQMETDGDAGDGSGDAGDGGGDAGDAGDAGDGGDPNCAAGTEAKDGGCVNIDECFEGTDACHVTATCSDLDPGYDCLCPDGYAGGGTGGAACVPRITTSVGFACAAEPDGAVHCWGDNSDGQLGDGTKTDRTAPTPVKDLPPAASVEAGLATTCAVLRDGKVSCWGAEAGSDWGGGGSTTPVLLGGLSNIVQVSLSSGAGGADTGCAVDRDGAVYCWGANDVGQTGTGSATGLPLARPKVVSGIGPARRVDVGYGQSMACATLQSGEVYCWGEGALTGPSTSTSHIPVKVPSLDDALQVIPGFQRVCALRYLGYLTCWGNPALYDSTDSGPVQVNIGETTVGLALGLYQTCVITDDHKLICWNVNTSPARVDSPQEYLSVDCSNVVTLALDPTDAVEAWNMNSAASSPNIPELTVQLP